MLKNPRLFATIGDTIQALQDEAAGEEQQSERGQTRICRRVHMYETKDKTDCRNGTRPRGSGADAFPAAGKGSTYENNGIY